MSEQVHHTNFANIEEALLSRLLDDGIPWGESDSLSYYDAVLGAKTRFRLARRVRNREIPTPENSDLFVLLNHHHLECDDRYLFIRETLIRLQDIVAYIRTKPGIQISTRTTYVVLRLAIEHMREHGAAVPLDRKPLPHQGMRP